MARRIAKIDESALSKLNLRAYVVTCLAVVSAGLVFLWSIREESAPPERTEVAPSADRLSERAESTTAKPDESVDPESGQVEQTVSEEAADSALAKRQKDMDPTGVQVSEEQTKELMECVAGFNDSDIVDRGVILEICTEEVFGEVP